MRVSKKLMLTGAAVSVGLATLGGSALVSADAASTSSTSQTSIVDKIASTFGLDKSKVQAVFDQNRTEHEAEQTKTVTTELDTLVSSGKITAAQEKLILAKRAELQTQRDANKGTMQSQTDAERKAAMDAERTSLDQWAKDNGIASDYLRYVFGGHGGPGGFHGPPPDADSSTSTSTN